MELVLSVSAIGPADRGGSSLALEAAIVLVLDSFGESLCHSGTVHGKVLRGVSSSVQWTAGVGPEGIAAGRCAQFSIGAEIGLSGARLPAGSFHLREDDERSSVRVPSCRLYCVECNCQS